METQDVILVVDDTKANIETLLELLGETYKVIPALDGHKALKILEKKHIDLILLDIMMPGMNGYEVCDEIKSHAKTKDIPIVFVTAKTDEDSIEQAYEHGGVDYITKPFRARELLSRVANHLALSKQQEYLKKMVELKTQEIRDTQKEIIFTMGTIGELRSQETGNHVKRVAAYCELLAKHYGLSEREVHLVKEASPMHDIGKVGIPDAILNKPGKYTPEEFQLMQQHAQYGYEILKFSNKELLKAAAIVAYQHHEKWNGTGYPNGLKGEEIHIYARITALSDVFDALGSARVYKEAWDDERIFKLLQDEKSEHFDPMLVDVFFDNLDDFLAIRDSLRDV